MRPDLFDLIRRIPSGNVTSYGAVGRALDPPTSGYLVGRAMATCPPDIPWWRVTARDGTFSIAKRDPVLALEQRDRLRAEGVVTTEIGVEPDQLLDADALMML
jgi:alkylated DNA nucleotide flippase Atl1